MQFPWSKWTTRISNQTTKPQERFNFLHQLTIHISRLQGALVVSWISWSAKDAWWCWFDTLGFQYLQLECVRNGGVGRVGWKNSHSGRDQIIMNRYTDANIWSWMAKAYKEKEICKKTGCFLKSLRPPFWTSCLDKVSVIIFFAGELSIIHPTKLTSSAVNDQFTCFKLSAYSFQKESTVNWQSYGHSLTIRNKSSNDPVSMTAFDYRR